MAAFAHRIRAGLLTATLLSLSGFSGALSAKPPEPGATSPQPQPDKALVYYIRTGRLSGVVYSIYLFADKTFVGVIPSGSYGYSHVDPGRRLFWTTLNKATREIELIPGETYYLDVWKEIALLDPARGQALIEKVSDLVLPSEEQRQEAEKYIAKRYEGALERESKREKVNVPELPPAVIPDNTEGMLMIPAYTKGVLEFMESVTSGLTPAGTEVLLRLAEDVVVDGQVVARGGRMVKGIVRESTEAAGFGKAGVLEVVVPGLKAEDGTVVPLVAQRVGSGREREDVATEAGTTAGAAVGETVGGIVGGAVGAGLAGGLVYLAVGEREAFSLAGERIRVWTRQDAWVRPSPAPAVAEPTPTPAVVSIPAHSRQAVRFKPAKEYRPDRVTIVLETETPPAEVAVTGVADLVLPTPLPSLERVRRSDGWHCTFDGWGLTRYLRVGQAPQEVTLSGRLDDGRAFLTTVDIDYQVER